MRTSRCRAVAAIAGFLLAGCATGTPVGFSGGDSWELPLVGPLEIGQLIVPVYVQDKGPYLMVLDPDTQNTAIDDAIIKELGVQTGPLGERTDETDTIRKLFGAEVQSLRIGTLTVGRRYYTIMKAGTLQVAGREIRGVIGRDVIADSLAFGFDRERGVAYIATQQRFTPPASAIAIGFSLLSQGEMVSRRMVKAQIGAKTANVHLDLGVATSQLRKRYWAEAGLTEVATAFAIRDDAGTIHRLTGGGIAATVTVGGVSAQQIVFAPFDDKAWDDVYLDGTVGLDVLRGHNVWANWDAKKFYATPRGDAVATTKERIGRWKTSEMDACAAGTCATIKLLVPSVASAPTPAPPAGEVPVDSPAPVAPAPVAPAPVAPAPIAPQPPSAAPVRPRPVLMVERAATAGVGPLELVLVALDAAGAPAPLPRLIVNLPAGTANASTQLGPDYAGTRLVVLDASPYPRACPRAGGCIDSLAP